MLNIIPAERIENKILLMRGLKVMLDRDLAELYGVETKVLNQAVKRNKTRFPDDFMFQLTRMEAECLVSQDVIPLRSQFVTLNDETANNKEKIDNLESQFATSNIETAGNKRKKTNLKSQIVTSSWGGTRKLPYVFTEQGVAMLSSVLKSERAIEIHPVKSLRDA